mmetsp:Transcript_119441/g.337991  ORF Transcript_119441/g.337991 Transcript_119441/m.337991 type:complete len:283 (-) Transcript_119441:465-1313(-)
MCRRCRAASNTALLYLRPAFCWISRSAAWVILLRASSCDASVPCRSIATTSRTCWATALKCALLESRQKVRALAALLTGPPLAKVKTRIVCCSAASPTTETKDLNMSRLAVVNRPPAEHITTRKASTPMGATSANSANLPICSSSVKSVSKNPAVSMMRNRPWASSACWASRVWDSSASDVTKTLLPTRALPNVLLPCPVPPARTRVANSTPPLPLGTPMPSVAASTAGRGFCSEPKVGMATPTRCCTHGRCQTRPRDSTRLAASSMMVVMGYAYGKRAKTS